MLTKQEKQQALKKIIEPKINLESLLTAFYAYQEFDGITAIKTYSMPSHIAWLSRYKAAQAELEENLALLMRDYLALACLGEARYGKILNLNTGRNQYIFDWSKIRARRENNYYLALKHNPTEILTTLEEFFNKPKCFIGLTGGSVWSKACNYGLKYGTILDSIYIDNLVDLEHHNGTIFSKPCLLRLECSSIIRVKAEGSLFSNRRFVDYLFPLPNKHFDIIQYGLTINNIKSVVNFESIPSQIYKPIVWGNKPLDEFYKTGSRTPRTRTVKVKELINA
jgi:hypothetical protein